MARYPRNPEIHLTFPTDQTSFQLRRSKLKYIFIYDLNRILYSGEYFKSLPRLYEIYRPVNILLSKLCANGYSRVKFSQFMMILELYESFQYGYVLCIFIS